MKLSELCSGIGGFTQAGKLAGFRTVFAADIDPLARRVYELNHGVTPAGDLAGIDPAAVPDHDLLAAGTPCQPHSAQGRHGGLGDGRSHVLIHVLKVLARKRPPAVVIENVAAMATQDGGEPLRLILGSLRGLGYRVSWRVLRASSFGAAQTRSRLFIVGSRGRGLDFDGVATTGPGRIAYFLDYRIDAGWLPRDRYTLLPEPLVTKSGVRFAGYLNEGRRKKPTGDLGRPWTHDGYWQVYDAEGVGQTITTRTNSRYLVLTGGRVRRITPDEVQSLMGFPPDFRIDAATSEAHRLLGNSLYVPCVAAVLRAVAAQVFSVRVTNGGGVAGFGEVPGELEVMTENRRTER